MNFLTVVISATANKQRLLDKHISYLVSAFMVV